MLRGVARLLGALSFSACSLLTSLPAVADEAEAKGHFQNAQEAYRQGDFAGAAKLFDEAHRLAPRAPVKYNAAIAWDHAGDLPRAALAYETALNMGGLTTENGEAARSRLTTLRSQLAYLRINEPIGAFITVGPAQEEPVPVVVYLAPGDHNLVANYRQQEISREVNLRAGETRVLELGLDTTESPATEPAPAAVQPSERVVDRNRDNTQEIWGWVGVGTGAVLSGLAIYLGVQALDARDESFADPSDPTKRSDAARLRMQTNIAWGSAGVVGITGVVLVLTSPTFHF